MTALQAVVMAILQGITELFPDLQPRPCGHRPGAACTGTSIKTPKGFLPFLAVMHLGTAIALLGYFWRDWLGASPALY